MLMSDHRSGVVRIEPGAGVVAEAHGERAGDLQHLVDMGLTCPVSVALSVERLHGIATGQRFDAAGVINEFGPDPLVSVLPSSGRRSWGGPREFPDVGLNEATHALLAARFGQEHADRRWFDFILRYATDVACLDAEPFDEAAAGSDPAGAALEIYLREAGEAFPQDPGRQLSQVVSSMATAWGGITARLLRHAQGAPLEAGLALLVQDNRWSVAPGEIATGRVRMFDPVTGQTRLNGSLRALTETGAPAPAEDIPTALQDRAPERVEALSALLDTARRGFRADREIDVAYEGGRFLVLDASPQASSARVALNNAMALVEADVITREEALLRVAPPSLTAFLHPQVQPDPARKPLFSGVAASPGGATGHVVFTADAAAARAAREEPCILVRRETNPEDIRGMHVAQAIVTERGGMTSHAAVIARGLGVPCITGASGVVISAETETMTLGDGRVLHEGDLITVDGTHGEAHMGEILMTPADDDPGFLEFMSWADAARDIGVRANADTPQDAALAMSFLADGIGLCRTEHMFFEPSRMVVMREMIFAGTEADRRAALDQLLPMQRSDFRELFATMAGLPVCIRLFDPPLHEFLPMDREGRMNLAQSLDLSLTEVNRRIEAISEFNPMLGMRGVRLGLMHPEIYEMQVRAIFEAAIEAGRAVGATVEPEIMIPLVAGRSEVKLVKTRIDSVAAQVRVATGQEVAYRLGVLVETPRAALCAGEIAEYAQLLSFGTNDLTQMTYGLSRDDVSRFMKAYVEQGALTGDPFEKLDFKGVGELIRIAADRGRATNPSIDLSICGEHGGDIDTIDFCRTGGFTYVSCSPYRVPIARLSAAQLAIRARRDEKDGTAG
ncbi:putative PEP-binding protein [Marinibacterium profundimaris]|uniref:Pyruvate, phosphate dikinase n=1 Tax=Marinibacterium profundimaris TaxID=1679460 RepID=A0A225NRY8_9RHOB|nr:putative PEP-binding protein [Marinibacterium profundimaris]OWU75598.1 pyruvate phosphate dikinase [Marinibacterium profundimaris]